MKQFGKQGCGTITNEVLFCERGVVAVLSTGCTKLILFASTSLNVLKPGEVP